MLKEIFQDSFENFEIHKDMYGRPCKRDWMAKVVFLIQMLPTLGGRCNRYFWDIRLKILKLSNFNMLFLSFPRCYNVFKAAPIVAYRRSSNLSDFLVKVKLRNPTQHNQPRGAYPCGKNYLTCKYIFEGQTSYTFHSTGETRPIPYHIDWNSKNVTYMIQYNHCSKQYIGEIERRLKDCFNEHHRPVDNPSNISKPTTISELCGPGNLLGVTWPLSCCSVSPNHVLVDSLCSVRVFKLFSRSIRYIFGDEERVRTPTAR